MNGVLSIVREAINDANKIGLTIIIMIFVIVILIIYIVSKNKKN